MALHRKFLSESSEGEETVISDSQCDHSPIKVLLLQGPVGPFFSDLHRQLLRTGCEVKRMAFGSADKVFGGRTSTLVKSNIDQWPDLFSTLIRNWGPTVVVLFGAERPAHVIARRQCADAGIPVLCLEEGYIRPGFITAEWGGNNAASPLAGFEPGLCVEGLKAQPPAPYRGFSSMARYAALYYTVRQIFASSSSRSFFHREVRLLKDGFSWGLSSLRRLVGASSERRKISHLISGYSGKFYLVPLQVSEDANLRQAACGWSMPQLARSAIESFAEHAPLDTRLVIKLHPMARAALGMRCDVERLIKKVGLKDRVDILDGGDLGFLTSHCAGMITINSTSGISAITSGRPLLVLGRSVYSSPHLATCASERSDIDNFWENGFISESHIRDEYLRSLTADALLPGDFYAREGRRSATSSIISKIQACS